MIALVLTWFRTNPRNVWLIAGLLAALAIATSLYVKGRSDQAARERARDAIAVAEALKSDAKADTKAQDQAERDAAVQAQKEKELTDAIANLPDGLPDAHAVRLGCERLRQAGVSVADLPACQPPRR